MSDQTRPPHRPRENIRRLGLAIMGVTVGLLIGTAAVLYGTGDVGKKGPIECDGAAAIVNKLDPLVHGEVAALSLTRPPRPVPDLAFKDADGHALTLADFKGKTVLLNFWATWCVPCRKEMPALDRLQGRLGGADFQVVAVNIDTTKLDGPGAFLREIGVKSLPVYTDSTAKAFQLLRSGGQAFGLPTTLLIDPHGCQIGGMAGPAEWDSPDAEKLIGAAKGAPDGQS